MSTANRLRCTASLIAIAIGTASAGQALAQPAAPADQPPAAAEDNEVSAVVVTGSRVATGATAPTPVTAVTPQTINQVEQPNIADALRVEASIRRVAGVHHVTNQLAVGTPSHHFAHDATPRELAQLRGKPELVTRFFQD